MTDQTTEQPQQLSNLREAIAPREYRTFQHNGLTVRMRTLVAKEIMEIAKHPAEHQDAIMLSYALVDENGDCTHTHDMEGVSYMLELPSPVYAWLRTCMNTFCLGKPEDWMQLESMQSA